MLGAAKTLAMRGSNFAAAKTVFARGMSSAAMGPGTGVAAAAFAPADELRMLQANAVDALCAIGERALEASGGVSYVQGPQGSGLACEVVLERDIIEDLMGSSLEDVLDSGRGRLHLSHCCFLRQTGPDQLAVAVQINSRTNTSRATQVLTAELGLMSLLAKYKAPPQPAQPTTPVETYHSRVIVNEADPYECPRFPVP
mmetsp:Transcript_9344/g.16510  ORF Transcript_9344/g.16510 Transcript_9344/m.16510 type:complete len:199 (-) Transcript_9344:201-797(-)|eukprot:CAMPEP_0171497130 /NCGR_PEP_ID=MMETSP0958-20121227/7095_1 /TAXON_ID=87120 /ORGANISM="Aurantiochytrium limacinum, Strain ATCCMYA-1381" /LENGTH=198 /DNA_ID=CAMNT_0012031327 /DNA_START=660 /DNA_END=1256 /DNA_ORIENTATION=+